MASRICILLAVALVLANSFAASIPYNLRNTDSYLRKLDSTVPTDLPAGWYYKGCYTDSVAERVLPEFFQASTNTTAESCIAFCTSKGEAYAGTEYGQECWCGSWIGATRILATGDCTEPCNGDSTQACGAPNWLSIYSNAAPQLDPSVVGWQSLGCYTDSVSSRILSSNINVVEVAGLTIKACLAGCQAQGFAYGGVEYAQECWCGHTIANDGAPATDGCSMTCKGNPAEVCGGANRLNLYVQSAAALTRTSVVSTTTSDFSTSTLSTSPSAANATAIIKTITTTTTTIDADFTTYASIDSTTHTTSVFASTSTNSSTSSSTSISANRRPAPTEVMHNGDFEFSTSTTSGSWEWDPSGDGGNLFAGFGTAGPWAYIGQHYATLKQSASNTTSNSITPHSWCVYQNVYLSEGNYTLTFYTGRIPSSFSTTATGTPIHSLIPSQITYTARLDSTILASGTPCGATADTGCTLDAQNHQQLWEKVVVDNVAAPGTNGGYSVMEFCGTFVGEQAVMTASDAWILDSISFVGPN